MKNAQNADCAICDTVGHDVWRAVDDEFASSLNATGTADLREPDEALNLSANAVIDSNRGTGIVGLDVVEDRIAIIVRVDRPFEPHRLALHPAFCAGAPLGKVRLDSVMRNDLTRVLKSLLHFSTEPCIVRGGVVSEIEGQ